MTLADRRAPVLTGMMDLRPCQRTVGATLRPARITRAPSLLCLCPHEQRAPIRHRRATYIAAVYSGSWLAPGPWHCFFVAKSTSRHDGAGQGAFQITRTGALD